MAGSLGKRAAKQESIYSQQKKKIDQLPEIGLISKSQTQGTRRRVKDNNVTNQTKNSDQLQEPQQQ